MAGDPAPPVDDGGTGPGPWSGPLGCPLDTFGPNYCEETDPSNGQVNALWWWETLPLKIHFTSAPTMQGQDLNTLALDGFNRWSSVVGRPVAVQVATAGEADVSVSYITTGTPLGRATVGYMPFNRQAFTGTVTFKTWAGMTVAEVTQGFLSTAQHEFGHILFIGGHSPQNGDSMYPYAVPSNFVPLTQRDHDSLKTTYCDSFDQRLRSSFMHQARPELWDLDPVFVSVED